MRIVCAVDGSEHSQWGIQALEALAGREPEHVVLLHIVDRPTLQAAKSKNSVAVKRALAAMEKAGTIVPARRGTIGPPRPRTGGNRTTHNIPNHSHAWSGPPYHCKNSPATEG